MDKLVLKLTCEIFIFFGDGVVNFAAVHGLTQNHSYYWQPGNHFDKSALLCIPVPSLAKYIIWNRFHLRLLPIWFFFSKDLKHPMEICCFYEYICPWTPFLNYFWEVNKWGKRSIELKLFCNWDVCLSENVAAFL